MKNSSAKIPLACSMSEDYVTAFFRQMVRSTLKPFRCFHQLLHTRNKFTFPASPSCTIIDDQRLALGVGEKRRTGIAFALCAILRHSAQADGRGRTEEW